jgi:hypothetical protein
MQQYYQGWDIALPEVMAYPDYLQRSVTYPVKTFEVYNEK